MLLNRCGHENQSCMTRVQIDALNSIHALRPRCFTEMFMIHVTLIDSLIDHSRVHAGMLMFM